MGDLLKNTFAVITGSTGTAGNEDAVLTGASIGCTVLSVSICNTTSTDGEFNMRFKNEDSNSPSYSIYYKQSVPAGATFIHNSKICLDAGDTLNFIEPNNDASSFDVVVTYLEQT